MQRQQREAKVSQVEAIGKWQSAAAAGRQFATGLGHSLPSAPADDVCFFPCICIKKWGHQLAVLRKGGKGHRTGGHFGDGHLQ